MLFFFHLKDVLNTYSKELENIKSHSTVKKKNTHLPTNFYFKIV